MTLPIHGEIPLAPPVHVVEGNGVFSAEIRHGRAEISARCEKIQSPFSAYGEKTPLMFALSSADNENETMVKRGEGSTP